MGNKTARYVIDKPKWKIPGVGLHERFLKYDKVILTIAYKFKKGPKAGKKTHPGLWIVTKELMLSCPTHMVHGLKMYDIPFSEMEHIERKPKKKKKKKTLWG